MHGQKNIKILVILKMSFKGHKYKRIT